jgi:hypothetical protein
MKLASLSKLAFWLLCHQVGGYQVESFVGDLQEEYTQGRSTGWLWRQVLLAIARSYLRALRQFGPGFLRAIAVGWGALLLGVTLLERTWAIVQHQLSVFSANFSAQQHMAPNAIDDIVVPLLALFIDLAVGRLVVRLYRPHQKFVVGVFAISILAVWDLPWLCAIAANASHLAEGVLFTFMWTASVWLGGLWQIRVEAQSAKTR